MVTYFGFFLLFAFALFTVVAMVYLHQRLGPKRSGRIHDMPFESGNPPVRIVRGRFAVKFFLVAILFILFDIELIFLFPWAVIYRELGLFGFVEMFIFLVAVISGLYYSVKRGALEWN
ncbi:MAG TPA: NADH-quinone oxidoreductase subunit A [Acidobacteriota bacterium]|nr:NADH-quinone oxidoreductase subunit A [Acidobacteriota bacterium]